MLTTTVDFAGIAFLTDPRRFSPVVSRVRMRTTGNSDLQWELDYDTKKGRINASTFYSTLHFGDFFVEASHAYLQVPGEIVRDPNSPTGATLPFCTPGIFNQPPCVPLVFNQVRGLVGYGSPSKRGWSIAAQAGVDQEFNLVQYSARPPTTGIAAASALSTAVSPWARCATRTSTDLRSRWPTLDRSEI